MDRYSYSGIAFSAAKPGMSLEWCREPEVGLPAPDVVIFLDIPIEKAALRGNFGDERYEKKDMQLRVRENFLAMQGPNWHNVDASASMDEVEESIRLIALTVIEEVGNSEVKELWD